MSSGIRSLSLLALLLPATALAVDGSVVPATYDGELGPGESETLTKTVTLPTVTPSRWSNRSTRPSGRESRKKLLYTL